FTCGIVVVDALLGVGGLLRLDVSLRCGAHLRSLGGAGLGPAGVLRQRGARRAQRDRQAHGQPPAMRASPLLHVPLPVFGSWPGWPAESVKGFAPGTIPNWSKAGRA